jgi:hypothetical protein
VGPLHSVTISTSISTAGDKLTVQDSVGDESCGIGLSVSLLILTDIGLGTAIEWIIARVNNIW